MGRIMPVVLPLIYFGLLLSPAIVFATTCTVTSQTCTQGAEMRLINGIAVYRDCWQWQETKRCEVGEMQNFCEPLENASCEERSSICKDSTAPGECSIEEKTFACRDALSPLPESITALPIETTVTDRWVAVDDCAFSDNCQAPIEVCTKPDEVREVNGVTITLACGEKEKRSECEVTPANPSCSLLQNVGCNVQKTETPLPNHEKHFVCHENITLPAHPDIALVDTRDVLDRIEVVEDTCSSLASCEIKDRQCVAFDEVFREVCVNETQTRLCNGVSDSNACQSLENLGCNEEAPVSETLKAYACTSELTPVPPHITEMERETQYTGMTPTDTCPDKANVAFAQKKPNRCEIGEEVCVEGPETRIVDGEPIYKDCWKTNLTYVCASETDNQYCEVLESDPSCALQASTCLVTGADGKCELTTHTFACKEREDETINQEVCTQTVCQFGLCTSKDEEANQKLTDTLSKLELARQAAVYGDYDNLRFFSGEVNTCRNKLGGVSCCQGKVRGDTTNSSKLNASYIFAKDVAQETIKTLGSPFVNDILANHKDLADIVTRLYGEVAMNAYSPSLSYYGLTVSYGASGLQFSFNPSTFFAMVALEVAADYLSCTQEEQALQLKRGSDLCHYIGSTCTEYNMGHCQTKTEVHCCFNSSLARVVQVAAHEQLGLTWGTPQRPSCLGLSAHEFAQVDLSKVDLSDLLAAMSSSASTPDVERVKTRALDRQQTINPKDPYAPMPEKDGVCTGNAC